MIFEQNIDITVSHIHMCLIDRTTIGTQWSCNAEYYYISQLNDSNLMTTISSPKETSYKVEFRTPLLYHSA